ncbi:uncharacterized protein F5891DRAFT_960402 [Suillus fuscotomentosus]|uniref:CxC1-like cysteine cluster associated with KDZ transposases domain-containing protein n=1 Tax=Suillus fuscotomentosus TaxID=1912939 RepID=A0AAD4DX88_9AGAM|nr:uncharacterized protein F5891DRAFT_960402 [Suillus fuscotomentosus]KAG1895322.1 hypothetical protein F5891DRAFT_960402 [Suillus fuscotomentosus]
MRLNSLIHSVSLKRSLISCTYFFFAARRRSHLRPLPSHQYPNETLIYYGYIGCAPMYPSVAISLRTLAAYRQSHRTCPRFSIQSQCKTLCYLHDIPYRPYLKMQFSAAYDVFLEILHRINQRLRQALKRDTVNWRMLNTCPACFYKLDDEPALDFEWLVSIDGNNSLKRWDSSIYGTTARSDSRTARSDYWIHADAVDKFENEVKSRQVSTDLRNDDDWEDEPTDPDHPGAFTCVNRWRNAGPDSCKKMFAVFQESGIFIASCRHRFVLLACDMIRSGELAKYPIAIIDKLLTVYGKNGGCAYDIGCAFSKTLANSTLGPRAHDLGFRMMVGAFHGHAHNRRCQLDWHPMYISGTGHTEGEGCEHIFSASNELARSTRHANRFHRHQAIEEHFAFWDADKYAALSNYLWTHYREALKSVRLLTAELETIKAELRLSDNDFPGFFDQERIYLDGLKQPAPRDRLSIRYVEVLDELAERRYLHIGSLEQMHDALKQARIRVNSSYAKLQHAEGLVAHCETLLSVDERWLIGGDEYKRFKEEATLGKYRTALDELERLVVMRLFELSKLSLSGTGYKLRQQISKALQRRSDTIRNTINRYNIQAASLIPPRQTIAWKDIAEYSFLGEFDLLRDSRTDIQDKDWARPAHREATTKYFKLCRAREEIIRLNIEIRRLRTAIHDETIDTSAVIDELLVANPLLAAELKRQWRSRAAINAVHTYRLDQIERLFGFSGISGIGTRLANPAFSRPVNTNGASSGECGSLTTYIALILATAQAENPDSSASEFHDIEALDREEHEVVTEDMADFLYSIND